MCRQSGHWLGLDILARNPTLQGTAACATLECLQWIPHGRDPPRSALQHCAQFNAMRKQCCRRRGRGRQCRSSLDDGWNDAGRGTASRDCWRQYVGTCLSVARMPSEVWCAQVCAPLCWTPQFSLLSTSRKENWAFFPPYSSHRRAQSTRRFRSGDSEQAGIAKRCTFFHCKPVQKAWSGKNFTAGSRKAMASYPGPSSAPHFRTC